MVMGEIQLTCSEPRTGQHHRRTGGKPLDSDMGRNAAAVLTALNNLCHM